jgi:hypothetical protein
VHHHFLHQFPNGWPIEEFLKTYLKNKRSYARKQGYLNQQTNLDLYDDDEEQEQEQEQEQEEERLGGKDKGNGKAIEQDDSEIKDPDVSDDMYGSDVPV